MYLMISTTFSSTVIPHFVENMCLANLLFYVFSKDFQILFHNNPLIFTNWEQKY